MLFFIDKHIWVPKGSTLSRGKMSPNKTYIQETMNDLQFKKIRLTLPYLFLGKLSES